MNSSKKIKYLFVARGPGETGQARSLARYIADKGGIILFCLHQKQNLSFLSSDKDFKTFITKTPAELKKIVEKQSPDVVLLFNSKMWGKDFFKKPNFPKPPLSIGVDSNWLFNNKKYSNFKFVEWPDKYFALFPKKIFELGLKKNGGDFVIEKAVLKKIIPVGFVPYYEKPSQKQILKTRKKYKIKPGEKFIFSYFSGFGAGHRIFAFNNLIKSIDRLVKAGRKIKVLYLGPTQNLDPEKLKKPWLIIKEYLPANEYFLTLASSDLVFQHQGMVTLAQAIAAQRPVICNVHMLEQTLPKIHFWEVNPFARAGVCRMFSKSSSIKKISQAIKELLYDKKSIAKMKISQKATLEQGEKKSFELIQQLLK